MFWEGQEADGARRGTFSSFPNVISPASHSSFILWAYGERAPPAGSWLSSCDPIRLRSARPSSAAAVEVFYTALKGSLGPREKVPGLADNLGSIWRRVVLPLPLDEGLSCRGEGGKSLSGVRFIHHFWRKYTGQRGGSFLGNGVKGLPGKDPVLEGKKERPS